MEAIMAFPKYLGKWTAIAKNEKPAGAVIRLAIHKGWGRGEVLLLCSLWLIIILLFM